MHSSETVRVGLIGYGLAGACFHAPFIAATPGLSLDVIVTRDAERRRQALSEHGAARVVDSPDWLWQHADAVDLVVVASPNRTHVPLAQAAIDAGLAVVIDKPIAPSAAEARALIDRARRAGRLLTVFQNRRWDGDFKTLSTLLRQGELGEPLRFESRFERWRPEAGPGWRQGGEPEDAGGVLFDFGSHLIDQALRLFGPAAHVYAEPDRRRASTHVDDDVFVAVTHESGVRSHLFMSWMAAHAGPRFRLLGSKAAYVKYHLDVQEEVLRAGGRPGGPDWGMEPEERWGELVCDGTRRPVPTEAGDYSEFYRLLAAAMRGEAPVPVDPTDAAAALDVIEAAQRSSASRAVVGMRQWGNGAVGQ